MPNNKVLWANRDCPTKPLKASLKCGRWGTVHCYLPSQKVRMQNLSVEAIVTKEERNANF